MTQLVDARTTCSYVEDNGNSGFGIDFDKDVPHIVKTLDEISSMSMFQVRDMWQLLSEVVDYGGSVLRAQGKQYKISSAEEIEEQVMAKMSPTQKDAFKGWRNSRFKFQDKNWSDLRLSITRSRPRKPRDSAKLLAVRRFVGDDTLTWENYYYFMNAYSCCHTTIHYLSEIIRLEQHQQEAGCGLSERLFEEYRALKDLTSALRRRMQQLIFELSVDRKSFKNGFESLLEHFETLGVTDGFADYTEVYGAREQRDSLQKADLALEQIEEYKKPIIRRLDMMKLRITDHLQSKKLD